MIGSKGWPLPFFWTPIQFLSADVKGITCRIEVDSSPPRTPSFLTTSAASFVTQVPTTVCLDLCSTFLCPLLPPRVLLSHSSLSLLVCNSVRSSLVSQMVKNKPTNAADRGSTPGSGRSPGEGNSNSLQYSCLEISMDKCGGLQSIGLQRIKHNGTTNTVL